MFFESQMLKLALIVMPAYMALYIIFIYTCMVGPMYTLYIIIILWVSARYVGAIILYMGSFCVNIFCSANIS